MRIGSLVHLETVFKDSMPLYSTWGNKEGGGDKPIGKIHPAEIGIVLETTEHRGGNGVKLLIGGDKVGWVNMYFLEVKE